MSKVDKMKTLGSFIQANVAPILVDYISAKLFMDNAVIIPANCDDSLLNGHYEEMNFVAPDWYQQVLEKSDDHQNILVIEDITSLSKELQMKFYELLKYRKIGVFDLPANCVIIVTAHRQINNNVNAQIYSLVAHVRG